MLLILVFANNLKKKRKQEDDAHQENHKNDQLFKVDFGRFFLKKEIQFGCYKFHLIRY